VAAVSPIGIDTGSRQVTVSGTEVVTTKREFDLLLFLARHPGRAYTRVQIMEAVWGHQRSGERTVDVHIRRLRTKLGDLQHHVETVHGFGYRLAADMVSVH
jgi:DNA-binding response OmpR family regulator